MSKISFITLGIVAILLSSCATHRQQDQSEVIPDVDKWFETERGFGAPDRFTIEHGGKSYLILINSPYSGRDATFSYILEKCSKGHVLLQKLHHPEGAIAYSVELEHDALVFKGSNKRPVLSYMLKEGKSSLRIKK